MPPIAAIPTHAPGVAASPEEHLLAPAPSRYLYSPEDLFPIQWYTWPLSTEAFSFVGYTWTIPIRAAAGKASCLTCGNARPCMLG